MLTVRIKVWVNSATLNNVIQWTKLSKKVFLIFPKNRAQLMSLMNVL